MNNDFGNSQFPNQISEIYGNPLQFTYHHKMFMYQKRANVLISVEIFLA